jgi:hypothetical protein
MIFMTKLDVMGTGGFCPKVAGMKVVDAGHSVVGTETLGFSPAYCRGQAIALRTPQ